MKELKWVAAELDAGRLTPAEATDLIRACEADAPATGAATALLMGCLAGGDAQGFGASAEQRGGGPGWVPQLGERVVVLTMGGAPGTVIQPPGKSGAKVRFRALALGYRVYGSMAATPRRPVDCAIGASDALCVA